MRFKIAGVEYGDGAPSLLDLIDLQEQSGITVDDLGEADEYLSAFKEGSGRSFLSDPKALKLLGATIWLSRRAAGEDLTFRQALSVPLDQIEFLEDDEEDEETAPDPHLRALTGGAADEADDLDEPVPGIA